MRTMQNFEKKLKTNVRKPDAPSRDIRVQGGMQGMTKSLCVRLFRTLRQGLLLSPSR